MTLSGNTRFIALSGPRGAGKSTFAALVTKELRRHRQQVTLLRIAEPLYQVQELIYKLARCSIAGSSFQDAELLTFLGRHFRKIRKTSLLDAFVRQIQESTKKASRRHVVLCSDARSPDLPFLRRNGFSLGFVYAPKETIDKRLIARGDANRTRSARELEVTYRQTKWDFEIDNSGSRNALRHQAVKIARLIAEESA